MGEKERGIKLERSEKKTGRVHTKTCPKGGGGGDPECVVRVGTLERVKRGANAPGQ